MSSEPPAAKEPPPPRAIVAGHGDFAAGMISAVAQVSGLGALYVPVSNTGLGPGALEELLSAKLKEFGVKLIFTDLPAGSCTIAARRIARTMPGLVVVAGVSLPTLLSLACGSDLETAAKRGRDGLSIVEGVGGA